MDRQIHATQKQEDAFVQPRVLQEKTVVVAILRVTMRGILLTTLASVIVYIKYHYVPIPACQNGLLTQA